MARKERERKKAKAVAETQSVENKIVGVRLAIPGSWRLRPEEELGSSGRLETMWIECDPQNSYGCLVTVHSHALPGPKASFTDEEWQVWEDRRPKNIAGPFLQLSSRNLAVAGHSAREVMRQQKGELPALVRSVFVLVPQSRRVYEFNFFVMSGKRFEEFAPAFESVLQSFVPLGEATVEQTAQAAEKEQSDALIKQLSAAEKEAASGLLGLALMVAGCKDVFGRFPSLQEATAGCKGPSWTLGALQPNPLRNPNYQFRLTTSGESFEITAVPKRPGLGGMLCDGTEVYYNQKGPASRADKVILKFPS
ncbi:MAG: hypothetical protein HYR58_06980 [Acidobacteria bacterium]|nr:hypothetical protein [Acidobacteriota bacterium]